MSRIGGGMVIVFIRTFMRWSSNGVVMNGWPLVANGRLDMGLFRYLSEHWYSGGRAHSACAARRTTYARITVPSVMINGVRTRRCIRRQYRDVPLEKDVVPSHAVPVIEDPRR